MPDLQENKRHGEPAFPFAVYRGNLPEYIRSYPLHWHGEMELISIISGEGIITVQAERYRVREGDMILIPPQTVHSIEQLEDRSMEYFNILFRLSLVEPEHGAGRFTRPLYSHSREFPHHLTRDDPLNGKLREPVEALIRNRKEIHSEYALMIRAHLYTIVYHILHSWNESHPADVCPDTSYDKLKVVLEYLRQNYPEEITVDQAADMCGFSASHFMKLFRELTGTSFTRYVKQLRLEEAAQLLKNSGRRVSEIAEAVGFHNLSYFTRAFAEQYQMSPGAYRKSQ